MLLKDYNEKYDFSGKNVEELLPNELSILIGLLEMLPNGVSYKITRTDNGQEYEFGDEFIEEIMEDYFDVSEEDIQKLIGKCFMDENKNEVVKIVGMGKEPREFLYEKYQKWDSDNEWQMPYSNWLQDRVYGMYPDESYKLYCLTDQTDMNIASENMYLVGKDGNLYLDLTCGNDYKVYKPIKETTFELIKEEALENNKEIQTEDD